MSIKLFADPPNGKEDRSLLGVTSGYLTAVALEGYSRSSRPYYRCRCDGPKPYGGRCVNEIVVPGRELTQVGRRRYSCGCTRDRSYHPSRKTGPHKEKPVVDPLLDEGHLGDYLSGKKRLPTGITQDDLNWQLAYRQRRMKRIAV